MAVRDQWAEWLAERRFGGDPEVRRRFFEELAQRADKVLDYAELADGETLLDVGCGDGLIGFRALERGAGTVIFSDISQDLLDFCREAAAGSACSSAAGSFAPPPRTWPGSMTGRSTSSRRARF